MADVVNAILFATLLILLLALTDNAFAETMEPECGSANEIISLITQFEEIPVFTATATDRDNKPTAFSGFVNYSTGTWTIVERVNRGLFCIVAFGQGWEDQ